jgi:hypothetical protein
VMRQLSRRDLLAAAVATCATCFGSRASSSDALGVPPETHSLLAACSDLKCPDVIGMACLRALPATEASSAVLVSLIAQCAAPQLRDLTSVAARRLVREQSRRDFRNGAVMSVDGWILSLTETRVYALTTLLAHEARQAFRPTARRQSS